MCFHTLSHPRSSGVYISSPVKSVCVVAIKHAKRWIRIMWEGRNTKLELWPSSSCTTGGGLTRWGWHARAMGKGGAFNHNPKDGCLAPLVYH